MWLLGARVTSLLLRSNAVPQLDEEERVPLLALADNVLALVELLGLDDIGDLCALIGVHGVEQLDLGEEGFVSLALCDSSTLDDMVEARAIKCKEHGVRHGLDVGGSWSVVEECEFAEGLSGLVVLQELWFFPRLRGSCALQRALIDDIKEISVIVLLNHVIAFPMNVRKRVLTKLRELLLLHSINYNAFVFVIEHLEHEGQVKLLKDPRALGLRFRDNSRLVVLFFVEGPVSFG